MYRSAKYNHSNYELIEYSNVLLTHIFYWWKDLRFFVTKIIFFGYTSRYLVHRVYSSTALCLSYCSFRSRIKIIAIVGPSEQLLLRTAVHSLTTTTIFFFLFRFDNFLPLHHQFFFWGFFIRITRWTKIRLSEDLSLKQAYHNAVDYDSIVQF